jgi:hypothetical protein
LALTVVLALAMIGPATAIQAGTRPATSAHSSVIQKSAAVSLFVAAGNPTTMQPLSTTKYVYVTRTGSKYHRSGCRSLRQSKIKKTLKWARSHGYGACKVCRPPTR